MATRHCVYDVCVCCVCEQRIDGRCSLCLIGYRTLCSGCVCVNRELMGGVPSVSMATGNCVQDVCVCE